MTHTLARLAVPAALAFAAFGAQAGEGPIDVRAQSGAAPTVMTAPAAPMTVTAPTFLLPGA